MKKVLFFLIIVCMLFVSCKDKGNESASNPAATTPLEGTWAYTTTDASETFTFAGVNLTMAISEQGDYHETLNDPSTPVVGTATVTFNMTGTFKLNNNQILVTPKTATLNMIGVPTANPSTTETLATLNDDNALGGLNLHLNQEGVLGTYTLNGNILAVTLTGETQPTNCTKQP